MTEEWTLRLVIPHHEDGGAFPADIVVDEDDEGRDDVECETRRYVPERETCHIVAPEFIEFRCSACGYNEGSLRGNHDASTWSYCPNCGRRVVV